MHITFLVDTPNVHLHYLATDEEAVTQGYSHVELVCHACGKYIEVFHKLPPKEVTDKLANDEGLPELVKIRDDFEKKHKNCVPSLNKPPLIGEIMPQLRGNNQFKSLCPPWRKFNHPEETIDLTKKNPL